MQLAGGVAKYKQMYFDCHSQSRPSGKQQSKVKTVLL
jgi:hypothetical protein